MTAFPPTPAPADGGFDGPKPLSAGDWLGLILIGWFAGLLFGGAIHNSLAAFGPVRTVPGTLERIEIDYSGTNTSGTINRDSYVLLGTTDAGEAWRIVDEEAYRVVDSQGYPQPVQVGIGELTGNTERVEGDGWIADQRSTGSKVFAASMLGVLGVGAWITAIILARARRYGPLPALAFALAFFVLGGVTGELLFGWFQSA